MDASYSLQVNVLTGVIRGGNALDLSPIEQRLMVKAIPEVVVRGSDQEERVYEKTQDRGREIGGIPMRFITYEIQG